MKRIFYSIIILACFARGYSQTAEEYFIQGEQKNNVNDYIGAISDFTKAIEINPYVDVYFYNRGNTKRYLQDYRGAIEDYTKAIEINNNYSEALHYRGVAKYELQDYRGAIEDFTQTIKLNPKYAIIYYYRGMAKIKLEQEDSGCLDLSKAGELGYPDAYKAIKKYCTITRKKKRPGNKDSGK